VGLNSFSHFRLLFKGARLAGKRLRSTIQFQRTADALLSLSHPRGRPQSDFTQRRGIVFHGTKTSPATPRVRTEGDNGPAPLAFLTLKRILRSPRGLLRGGRLVGGQRSKSGKAATLVDASPGSSQVGASARVIADCSSLWTSPGPAVWFAFAEIVESLIGQHVPQRTVRRELNSPKILATEKLES